MPVSIIERPYNISYSLNDIRYIFQLSDLSRPGLKLQVKLLSKPLGGVFSELYTFILQPALDGTIALYLQDYLHSQLSYVLPDFNANNLVTNADKQACIYTIQFRELEDNTAPGAYDESEAYYILYALKGGIEKHLHSRNNFFKYFEARKPFLTWQPTDKFIDFAEQAFLTFLNPDYNSEDLTQDWSLCYKVTDCTGNTDTGILPFGKTGLLFHLRIRLMATLSTVFPVATWYALEFGVISTGDLPLYGYRYFFEHRPRYSFYDLIYFNSLGGVDLLRVKGDVSESVERTTSEGSAGMDILDTFAPYKAPESFFASIALQKKYKGDIGYLKSKNQQYSFLDVLAAPAIYQVIAFRYVPVINLVKSQDLGTCKASLNSFPIEWALSESNEVYTPALTLDKGDLTMLQAAAPTPPLVCPVVNNMVLSINADNMVIATFTQFTADQLSNQIASLSLLLRINGEPFSNWIAYNPNSGTTIELIQANDGQAYSVDYKTNCNDNTSAINSTNTVQLQAAQEPATITLFSNTGTPGGTRTEAFDIGAAIYAGNQYYVEVYLHKVIYVAQADDTPESIAVKLANLINVTTADQWNDHNAAPAEGTPGFTPFATATNNVLYISLNYQNQFAAGVMQ